MSILAHARVIVDLKYTKQNVLKILEHGSKLQCKYIRVGNFEEIGIMEAADLSIASINPNWVGDFLSILSPPIDSCFDLTFLPEDDKLLVSFSGFDRNPLERSFKYKLEGIDFSLYIDLLLKFVESYRVIDIEVGYDH